MTLKPERPPPATGFNMSIAGQPVVRLPGSPTVPVSFTPGISRFHPTILMIRTCTSRCTDTNWGKRLLMTNMNWEKDSLRSRKFNWRWMQRQAIYWPRFKKVMVANLLIICVILTVSGDNSAGLVMASSKRCLANKVTCWSSRFAVLPRERLFGYRSQPSMYRNPPH